MTITRGAVVIYLSGEFSSLAEAVGQTASNDTPEGYKADVDNALRMLGTAESDLATATVEDSQRAAFFALAEYYAARRFWRRLGDRVNVKVDDSQFDYRYQLENARQIVENAAELCARLGYSVDGRARKRALFEVY